jgi:hypothetical protein
MAYAFVAESEASSDATGSTIAVTLATNPTAGNLLWMVAAGFADTTCSFSDTLSNTMTDIGSVREAAIADRIYHAYAKNITGGADTVTATFGVSITAPSSRRIYVLELSGLDTTSPLVDNVEATDTGSNPTDTDTCTNAGTAGVFLLLGADLQGGTLTVAGGLTLRANVWAGVNKNGTLGYKATIADSSNYTGAFSNASFDRNTRVGVIFQEPYTPPPPAPIIFLSSGLRF